MMGNGKNSDSATDHKESEQSEEGGAPTPDTPGHNWKVAKGHFRDCNCFTCVRMNCT